MRLAITEKLYDDESPLSAAIRHAGLNSYDSSSWVADLCGRQFPQLLSDHEALARLADWLDIHDPAEMVRRGHAPSPEPGMLNFWGEAVLPQFVNMKIIRLCPICIREQPYLKSIWSLDLCRVCHIHACPLIDTWPGCKTPIGHDRANLNMCECDKCRNPRHQPEKVYPAAARFWRHVHRLVHRNLSGEQQGELPRQFETLTVNGLLSSLALFQALHVKGSGLDTLETALQRLSGINDTGFYETQESGAQIILDWPVGIRKRLIEDLRRPAYEARILEHAQAALAPLLSWQLPELQFIEREIYDSVGARWRAMLRSFRGDAYVAGDDEAYLASGDAEAFLDMKPAELRQCFDTHELTPGKMSGSTRQHLYVVDRQLVHRALDDLVLHEDGHFDRLDEHLSFTRACLAAYALKMDGRSLLLSLRRGEISFRFAPGRRNSVGTMQINYASLIDHLLSADPAAEHEWISFNQAVALSITRPSALEGAISRHSLRMRGEKGVPDTREVHVGSLIDYKRRRLLAARLR